MAFRYGPWHGGPDPLAPPYDAAAAVDELGEDVLAGHDPREALEALLRRRGLDDLRRRIHERRRATRERGRLDGTLEEVRALLDTALEQERTALFADPSDRARLAETELDTLPTDTARAVRQLADYQWTSPEAVATYQRIRDLLRREVLDSQFRGLKESLEGQQDFTRVKDMLTALNELLDADARGADTTQAFADFMATYGDFFPEQPRTLDELIDALARRAAAAQRMLASLTPAQRDELAGLIATALDDLDLAREMDRLRQALRQRRPDLGWSRGERIRGDAALGLGDAVSALEELADLDELDATLRQDYQGASLDDIDPAALERTLGRAAVADLETLRALERQLVEQGYLVRRGEELELSPKAVRRIGAAALARIFRRLDVTRRGGDHDVPDAGAAGELTGASRPWQFGDEQPIDVVRTVRNAVVRRRPGPGAVTLTVDDIEVIETERRTAAAICLLVDLSYSMALRNTWGAAKTTALALHSLVTTRFPQDQITIIGFSDYARELRPVDLAGLSWDMVQGTNLQHALLLARHRLARHPDAEPVVLVVTDGEPTAHLQPGGAAFFAWPPAPETVDRTMAEVMALTRAGATINVFMLDDEPRLVRFVEAIAKLNGGRVFAPATDRLGDYVVSDYLRARRGRR